MDLWGLAEGWNPFVIVQTWQCGFLFKRTNLYKIPTVMRLNGYNPTKGTQVQELVYGKYVANSAIDLCMEVAGGVCSELERTSTQWLLETHSTGLLLYMHTGACCFPQAGHLLSAQPLAGVTSTSVARACGMLRQTRHYMPCIKLVHSPREYLFRLTEKRSFGLSLQYRE